MTRSKSRSWKTFFKSIPIWINKHLKIIRTNSEQVTPKTTKGWWGPELDFELIKAAFNWLPQLSDAKNIEERANWIAFWIQTVNWSLEFIKVEIQRKHVRDIDMRGPYDWDQWVFKRITEVILQLETEAGREKLWKPILELGGTAPRWVESFILKSSVGV